MASTINQGRYLPRFPATMNGSGFVSVSVTGLTATFGADYRPLVAESSSLVRANYLVAIQNVTTGIFWKVALPDLLASYQPLDATLTALAALDSSTGLLEQTGADAFTKRGIGTGASTSILTRADGDARFQPLDGELTAIAGLTSAADNVPYFTGSGTAALASFTSYGRTLVATANAAGGRTALGLGAISTLGAGTGLSSDGTNLNLANTAVTPGTYTYATVTVDAQGRATAASSGSAPSAPTGVLTNHGISASASAGALTISLTDATGATPSGSAIVSIPFRSATAATGTVTQRNVTSANSITLAASSTLGVPAINTPFSVWVVAFDDAGTVRLGVINSVSGTNVYQFKQSKLASSTLVSSTATAAQTFYTAGAGVSAKAYCPIARLEWSSGLAALGTWTAPTLVELWGPGMALPGDVVQIRHVVKTDTFTSSTTGALTDITGLSASISPSSAHHIVRAVIRIVGQTDTSATAGGIALLRGSTNIGGGTAASNRVAAIGGLPRTTDGNSMFTVTAEAYDAPGTTASTTYKGQFIIQTGATIYIGRTATDSDVAGVVRGSSSITLWEIAA